MPNHVKLTDGSACAQLKKLGYDAYAHKPHWTFEANEDKLMLENLYSLYLKLGIDYITTNTYHFGSTLDDDIPENRKCKTKFEGYFKNACEVLENLVDAHNKVHTKKVQILGSVGTYATRFHDCSEYNGRYIEKSEALENAYQYFDHVFQTFREKSSIRNFIVETVPTETEARAVLCLLDRYPDIKVIISFTMKEDARLRHGEPISSIAGQLHKHKQVIGIGINCTDPGNILPVLKEIKDYDFEQVFVYPNIGDQHFVADEEVKDCPFTYDLVKSWVENGATVIGGCCGIDDDHLRILKTIVDKINAENC